MKNIFGILLLSVFISLILLILNYYISCLISNKSFNLLSNVYECGFNPYLILRKALARFYLVAILFLLFDLELIYFLLSIFINLYYYFYHKNIITIYICFLILLFISMIIEYKNKIISKSGF